MFGGEKVEVSKVWVAVVAVAMLLLLYLIYTDLSANTAFPLKKRYRQYKCNYVETSMPPGLNDPCIPLAASATAAAVAGTVGQSPVVPSVAAVLPPVSPATAGAVAGFRNRGFTSFTQAVNGGRRMMDQSVRS
jgi:hypothetical protein